VLRSRSQASRRVIRHARGERSFGKDATTNPVTEAESVVSELEAAEVGLGFFQFGKETLFGLELTGVDAAPASLHADRVFEVEHLVVEQVFDGAARGIGAVEDAAHHDGVVGGVVVAEHAAGMVGAPGEDGTAEETVEEACVERIEDFVEIEVMADRGEDSLAASGLANVFGLSRDGVGGDVAAVAVRVGGGDGLAVELGKQDVSDGVVHGCGRVLEQVGEADVELAFAQTDGGVQRGETAKAYVEGRDGGTGPESAVLLFKDGYKLG